MPMPLDQSVRRPLELSRGDGSVFSELLNRLGNEHASEVAALHAQIDSLRTGKQIELLHVHRGAHVQKPSPVSLKPPSSMQNILEDRHLSSSEESPGSFPGSRTLGSSSTGMRSSSSKTGTPQQKQNRGVRAVMKPFAVQEHTRPVRLSLQPRAENDPFASEQRYIPQPRAAGSIGSFALHESENEQCDGLSKDHARTSEVSGLSAITGSAIPVEPGLMKTGSTRKSSQRKADRDMKIAQSIFHGGMLAARSHQHLVVTKDLSSWVDTIGGIVIILNVIQMGVSTDFQRDWKGWFVVDGCFAAFFLLEMIAKICIAKSIRVYFCGDGATWNIFDAFIVVLAMFEICIYISGASEKGGVNFSFFRTIRLCRLARLTRLLRLSFFKELKLMVMGLFFGARTLFWSFILILLPLYPVAIILRETLGEIAQDDSQTVKRNFETIGWSWFTMFRCIMGDCNDDSGKPIFVLVTQNQSWIFALFYCAVIMISVFGLFNVIIAIYVENVMDAAKHNDVIQKRRRLADEKLRGKLTSELVQFFVDYQRSTHRTTESPAKASLSIAENISKVSITQDVFDNVMKDPEAQKLLDKLDISDEDRFDLFEILDADCSGEVEVHELVLGILKLRGSARRGDVVACRLILMSLQDVFSDFCDHTAEVNSSFDVRLEQIASHLGIQPLAPLFAQAP